MQEKVDSMTPIAVLTCLKKKRNSGLLNKQKQSGRSWCLKKGLAKAITPGDPMLANQLMLIRLLISMLIYCDNHNFNFCYRSFAL